MFVMAKVNLDKNVADLAYTKTSVVPRLLALYGKSGKVPYISLWSSPA